MSTYLPRTNIELLFKIATTAENSETRARAREIIEDEAGQQNGIVALLSDRALSADTYFATRPALFAVHPCRAA